ncbi:MAG: AmmeMemoRadiSam system radical SAM enzyme, partial [Methanoregulaceae archaeon]|nr:AmmeMemoRadiSam system radical SAM enzyme [Methanoregulaceae archaeon]
QPVLDSTIRAKEHGMHVETVTLVIPGLNDNPDELDALIRWVLEELGPDTPMHFTRFHPDYRMTDRTATPLPLLEKIYGRAKELGIRYPYLGNVARHPFESTYCPACGGLLIERSGLYAMQIRNLEKDRCRLCGEKIAVVSDVGHQT